MCRDVNPPERITTHRHRPSVRRGGKASRGFVVGRSVDEFDKQITCGVAAVTSPEWETVGFNCVNCKWEPRCRGSISIWRSPRAPCLSSSMNERTATSIASMRDSSKATRQLIYRRCFDGGVMQQPAARHGNDQEKMSCFSPGDLWRGSQLAVEARLHCGSRACAAVAAGRSR
jgi:hypothetical protein